MLPRAWGRRWSGRVASVDARDWNKSYGLGEQSVEKTDIILLAGDSCVTRSDIIILTGDSCVTRFRRKHTELYCRNIGTLLSEHRCTENLGEYMKLTVC